LLSFPDPQLFAWLLSQEKPADARLIFIIEKIRHHASTRI
jgi:succinate dehydrogenase flavin-adding protein (antitoxin of CptAB toxin-antitoxin module)